MLEVSIGVEHDVPNRATVSDAATRRECWNPIVSHSTNMQNAIKPHQRRALREIESHGTLQQSEFEYLLVVGYPELRKEHILQS